MADPLPEFDTQALRQASQMPWPKERKAQMQLYTQNAQDLAGAADYIEELWERLGMKGGVARV